MKCFRCGGQIADTRRTWNETDFCSDACENGDVTVCELCGYLVDTDNIVSIGDLAICTDCEPEGDDQR